jgi:hypothetical protein
MLVGLGDPPASTPWTAGRLDGHPGHIDWFNHRSLHGELGEIPALEYEEAPTQVRGSPDPL